jgi:uncharacterized protein YjbJ (UPF0337 family)
MNRDRLQGIWKQLRGKMRVGRAKLTNDQLGAIDGRREICAGRLQEAYGIGKDAADRTPDCIESMRGDDSLPCSGN